MAGPAANPAYPSRTLVVALLGAMILAAAGFALFFLPQSLRLDEAQSLWETSRTPAGILTMVAEDVHVPLYHEVLHAWRNVVGDSVVSARALSLLFFLAGIPAIYFLGALLYEPAVALFAALLFALSPFMNWYGSEIRMYTFFALVAMVHQYFFVRLWKREEEGAWIGYGITAVIGIYVHYFFFLLLGAEAVFFLLQRGLFQPHSWKRFRILAGIVLLSFLPWAAYVIHAGQAQNQQPLLPIPTTVNLFGVFTQFLLGFQIDPVNTVFLSLWPLVIAFAFFALRKRPHSSPETDFLILSVVVPVSIAFLVSFAVPLFVSRYLIFVAPPLYLLVAHMLSRYPGITKWWVGGALVALMVLMLGVEAVSAATPVKEDYRDAVAYLSTNAHAQDVIIVSAPFTIYPIEYYYRGSAPLVTLPEWNRYAHGAIPAFDPATLPTQVRDETKDAQYAWVVLSYDQGYQRDIEQYFDNHFAKVDERTFSSGLAVAEYRIRYDTPLSSLTTGTTTAP